VNRVARLEHERRYAVRAVPGDGFLMLLADLHKGGVVGDRALDERCVEPGVRDHAGVYLGYVRLETVEEERTADRRVPTIERVVAELTSDQRPDPQLPEAVPPRAFPRVPLALYEVDLLEGAEPPGDGSPNLEPNLTTPYGAL